MNYNDNDIIVTCENEVYFYWQICDSNEKIKRLATKQEAKAFSDEYYYWRQSESDNIGIVEATYR